MEIHNLNKEFLKEHIEEFIELDKEIGEGRWTDSNFLVDLPEKWNLSIYTEKDGKIIGYIIASKRDDIIHIHRNVIHRDWQNQGVGSKSLQFFLKSKCRGRLLFLKVHKENERSLAFHLKHNLEIVGEENDYYLLEYREL